MAGAWLLCRIVCDSIELLAYHFADQVGVNVGPWSHGPDVKVWVADTIVGVDLHQDVASVFIKARLADTTSERADRIVAASVDRWSRRA